MKSVTQPQIVRISNWRLVADPRDAFKAPELRGSCLCGIVHGHPKKRDGREIVTSSIVGVRGRLVITSSGTHYRLGPIQPEYRVWLKTNSKYRFDQHNPLKRMKLAGAK